MLHHLHEKLLHKVYFYLLQSVRQLIITCILTKYVLFKQIIEGLGYIHKKRILHRDIKPKNILVSGNTADARVFIADFGIAAQLKDAAALERVAVTRVRQVTQAVCKIKRYTTAMVNRACHHI